MTKIENYIIFFLLFFLYNTINSQDLKVKIDSIEYEIQKLEEKKENLISYINKLKLNKVHDDLIKIGLPTYSDDDEIIHHSAFSLSYNEKHEQANWVAHITSPDIINPGFTRTNDFRVDPKVSSGSSVEGDFFLKYLQEDSTYEYDGFGYDRGHLAPSADFRWSLKAMSESYYYSNMSPQLPEFNREIWAELESIIREYVQEKEQKVFVVTGPILKDNLPILERSINKVSIPEEFYKVIIDIDSDTISGIGFIMPHEECEYPVMSYAVTIDEVEKKTGIDFFASLQDDIENTLESGSNFRHWQTGLRKPNVSPIHRNKLPKNCINTVQARSYYDSKAKVCGTIVEVHETKNGHFFINFDQDFPENLFWCTIWKSNIINFSYNPQEYLLNKKICVKGIVKKKYGKPSMSIYNEKAITLYEDELQNK